MSPRALPPRSRPSRRRKARHHKDLAPRPGGAPAGSPRFLARPKAQAADVSSASEHEARGDHQGPVQEAPVETPLGRAAGAAMAATPGTGRPLGQGERAQAEARLGEDFSDVRLVEESPLAPLFGANAMTRGATIHIAPGRYSAPGLIGHELTHVAQQRRFGGETAQFDMSIGITDEDTGLGAMDISLVTGSHVSGSGATMWGMETEIDFLAHDFAPYSNRIGLIQTVDVEETAEAGEPDATWTGGEANRENVKTPEGTFVDMHHGGLPADRNAEQWYWQGRLATVDPDDPTEDRHFGWNRAPNDRESTELWDFPAANYPLRYRFETVAIGRDNQTVYGAVRWGFETDGRTGTSREWAEVPQIFQSGSGETYQTEEFEAAREAFRDFYVHEPVVVYFGFDERVPTDTELGKMDDVAGYMTDNPDAVIRLTASADMQGGAGAYNRRLALDRMNAVETHLLSLGIAPGRILREEAGAGASRAEGSQDVALRDTEGSYQANRRVTLTFENTQSLPP